MEVEVIPGFKNVPRTGVIYVMTRAAEMGCNLDNNQWINLGQGAPEEGVMTGSPERIHDIQIEPIDHSYAPIEGLTALREKVAVYYNERFRKGMSSKYTYKNVAICGGGRMALTRLSAALGKVNMGHFLPDYTAYEELLSLFRGFIPIPILLKPEDHFQISPQALKEHITGLGLRVLLISNPCNPTGHVITGDSLKEWVGLAREFQCSMIFDEFYSHYIYDQEPGFINSAARFVDDVNRDPIILVDGLTKNWRYPSWRVSWIVGPEKLIESVASVASFLDGGANRPLQKKALELFDPHLIDQETLAIQSVFKEKRDLMISGLRNLGFHPEQPPGAFYFWLNLEHLPEPLSTGTGFFEAALKEQVITVPGVYFDVNPGHRRTSRYSKYNHYTRLSFGPQKDQIEEGLRRIQKIL